MSIRHGTSGSGSCRASVVVRRARMNCAGVDWATAKHDVLVENERGERLLSASFAHSEAGIGRLCAALVRLEVARVAIERPDGVLVERLLDAGLSVLALHPNQVKAARPRF